MRSMRLSSMTTWPHTPTLVVLSSMLLSASAVVPHPSVSRLELPLAPYNAKMFCQSGLATAQNRSWTPVLCPSASTTCGYFAISTLKNDHKTVIFECADSSVFMSEEDESSRDIYYSYLCSHQSRCHKVPLIRLNRQFLTYLEQTYNLDLSNLIKSSESIKFCCSNNYHSLTQLITSNSLSLASNSTSVKCSKKRCMSGAVGCMSHKKEKPESTPAKLFTHDYVDIKPVQILWQYDESLLNEYPVAANTEETYDLNRLHCVYPHFNDEVYRYCLLIEAQNSQSQCWTTRGHKICCCFLSKGEETCTPSTSTTTPLLTTTQRPVVRSAPKSRPSLRRKIIAPPIRKKKCPNLPSTNELSFSKVVKTGDNSECDWLPVSYASQTTCNYLLATLPLFIAIYKFK